ncbi:hypothetical protein ACP4OV_008850 [Aristida adscensionis]
MFGHGHQRPSNYKELFNHRHAVLRNHIERAIGVLKKRFLILKVGPHHSISNQVKIPAAAAIFHNLIRMHNGAEERTTIMFGRGSPRINLVQATSMQKKASPKCAGTQKKGTSARVGTSQQKGTSPKVHHARANWNAGLEKGLVDLLHEHNSPCYRSQNAWTSEDKEKELKRDYRTLKEARKQSRASWNECLGMIDAQPVVWDNIITSHPKAKKFVTKPFLLFESLGELYDGQTAEGTYNFTSLDSTQGQPGVTQVTTQHDLTQGTQHDLTQSMQHDLTQVGDGEAEEVEDDTSMNMHHDDDDDSVTIMPCPEEASFVPSSEDRRSAAASRPKRVGATASARGKEPAASRGEGGKVGQKRNVVAMMESYLDMKAKQVELETAEAARAMPDTSVDDFSIKKCISVLNTMEELTSEEKAHAYDVFKDPQDREIFMTAEPITRLIWMRKKLLDPCRLFVLITCIANGGLGKQPALSFKCLGGSE